MSHSDIDSPVPPQASVKLPWESIDPPDLTQAAQAARPTARNKKPRRKAKASAAESLDHAVSSVSSEAEMEDAEAASTHRLSHSIKPIFRTLPQEGNPSSLRGNELEEAVVAHAFLSDDATDFIEVEAEQDLVPRPSTSVMSDAPGEEREPPPESTDPSFAVDPGDYALVQEVSANSLTSPSEDKQIFAEKAIEAESASQTLLTEVIEPATALATNLDASLDQALLPNAGLDDDDEEALSRTPPSTELIAPQALLMPATVEQSQSREESHDEFLVTTNSDGATRDEIAGTSFDLEVPAEVDRSTDPANSLPRKFNKGTASEPVEAPPREEPQPEINVVGNETFLVPLSNEEEIACASIAAQPEDKTHAATLPELELEMDRPASAVTTGGGGWTIPLMCAGICLIACCLVIPQADYNRRLMYERQSLQANLDSAQRQVRVNDAFLAKVMNDPNLAERLASRQLKSIRKGQKVLAVNAMPQDQDMSPFSLTTVAPPPRPLAYKPVPGKIADLCNVPRTKAYVLGVAMTMVAVGLVMGFGPAKRD